jgi:GNAT superfamily N-acetyltransferase
VSSDGVVDVTVVRGADIAPHLDPIAQLRIVVFREWPYLYDGDLAYERRYLERYTRVDDSLIVLVRDQGRVVGASSGLPLTRDEPAFQQPFLDRGLDVGSVFYFGESLLLPVYRGQGLGHRFFDERERHAAASGNFTTTAFAAVDRAADDPRRPPGHRGNEEFWRKRGYIRHPGMTMRLSWKQVGETQESAQQLTFWLRG